MFKIIILLINLSAVLAAVSSNAGSLKKKTVTPYFESVLKDLQENQSAIDAEARLTKVFSLWNDVGPAAIIPVLEEYAKNKKISAGLRSRARYLSAKAAAKIGQLEKSQNIIAQMGYIKHWNYAGPFSNEGGIGFEATYSPENDSGLDPDTGMEGKGKTVYWRTFPLSAVHMGFVYLSRTAVPFDNSCYYAKTVLVSRNSETKILRIGSGGAFKAFWNGVLALDDDKYRASWPDRYAAEVLVKKGENTLLVKVCTEEIGDFGFYARLTDSLGEASILPSIIDLAAAVPVSVNSSKSPKRIRQPLEVVENIVAKRQNDLKALSQAVRYLYYSDSKDLNTTELRDMAKHLCEATSDIESCFLWSNLALDRNERRFALVKAEETKKDGVRVYAAMAELELEGPEPARALPYIEKLKAEEPGSLIAAMLEMTITASRGFARTAFMQAEELDLIFPDIPKVIDFAQYMADISGSVSKSIGFSRRAISFNYDEIGRHQLLAEGALNRGDIEMMEQHIKDMLLTAPHLDETYAAIAKMYEGAGSLKRAENILRERLSCSPDNADAMIDLGMFLMRENMRDEAVKLLADALHIRPQDTLTSEYLRLIGTTETFESSYIVPDTVFLALREQNKDSTDSAESKYLVDQTVVEVYESGLSSTYRQVVFEIGNRADAKEHRLKDIQYSADRHSLKVIAANVYRQDGSVDKIVNRGAVSVSEPWYRLYYDVVAEILEFPSLNPGDIVELSYKIEDFSGRNIFNDYFGDFSYIEDVHSKNLWRYAVIAPKSRELRFNRPSYPLESSTIEDNGKIIYSFEARDIPAMHKETDMPGISEAAAYLHVSTYRSWEELGRWYQGLLRHQMVSDSRIRTEVKKLIEGKKTIREKVNAIYNWVVTATRYVGLEFGIHGYKPYRASQVVSRGFGDCKDKASLLITMLKEAGVTAEFVLIRTRDLGLIAPEPASLAVFNHAIAYVPELKLYLDGTAEHHGIDELPFGDQGASALILRASGPVFVTTPIEPSNKNLVSIISKIELDKEGNAKLHSSSTIKGKDAATLRRGLESEATRRDRFQSSLSLLFPGARLDKLHINSLSDLLKPVAYEFTADLSHYAELIKDDLVVPLDDGLNLTSTYARMQPRYYDLIIGPARIMERTVEIVPPEGFVLADFPKSAEIQSRFGSLSFKVEKTSNRITVSRKFELSAVRITPQEYDDFIHFIRSVDEVLLSRSVFRRAK